MPDIIVWTDIPVTDLERASAFYAHVLGMPVVQIPDMEGIALPMPPQPEDGGPGEMVVAFDLYKVDTHPGDGGPTVYLGSGGDIDAMAARVTEAGGEVLQEKRFMGPMVGWIVFFRDTEGNRIGIQQPGDDKR